MPQWQRFAPHFGAETGLARDDSAMLLRTLRMIYG
jgi:hypothetical protein